MITHSNRGDRIIELKHLGEKILEISFSQRGFLESETLIDEYAITLSALKPGRKARVLINFDGAAYDPRLALFWKAQLSLFHDRIEKSAVIGASAIIKTAIQGFIDAADFVESPTGPMRAVLFESRNEALDFLAR